MKTAHSYIRFSTPEQAKGDSLRRQLAASKQWCKENGYTLSEQSFFDSGKSGYKGEHLQAKGELKKFLSLVESGNIPRGSVLLVENFDRISRLPPVESINLFLSIIMAGIGVVFTLSYDKRIIDKELLNKDPFVLQMVIAECIRAYTESSRKSVLIKASKQAKIATMKAGKIVAHNNVPKYFSFEETRNKYTHNENTKIVRELIEGIQAGKSLYSLADSLNAREISTFRRGFQWSGNSISKILKNRVLIGEYLGVKNFLPPIIEEGEFNKVQNILTQNSFNSGQGGAIINIFRGICFCADCGKTMQVSAQFKNYRQKARLEKPYRYLRCSMTGKHAKCRNRKYIQLTDIEEQFFACCLFKNPAQLVNDEGSVALKQLNNQIAANQTKLNNLNLEIAKMVIVIDITPIEELKTKLPRLEAERNAIKAELDKLNAAVINLKDLPENLDDIKEIVTGYDTKDDRSFWAFNDVVKKIQEALADNATRERVRVMLPNLISKITVDTNKGQFYVWNRMGKMIYESMEIESHRNQSVYMLRSVYEQEQAEAEIQKTIMPPA